MHRPAPSTTPLLTPRGCPPDVPTLLERGVIGGRAHVISAPPSIVLTLRYASAAHRRERRAVCLCSTAMWVRCGSVSRAPAPRAAPTTAAVVVRSACMRQGRGGWMERNYKLVGRRHHPSNQTARLYASLPRLTARSKECTGCGRKIAREVPASPWPALRTQGRGPPRASSCTYPRPATRLRAGGPCPGPLGCAAAGGRGSRTSWCS
jgi:hypothetical protein